MFVKSQRSLDIIYLKTLFYKNNKFTISLLICACMIAYFPTFNNRFQDFWDDTWVVINSYTEAGLNSHNIYCIFTQFYHGQYAPVNELFYVMIYNVVGYSAVWFHGLCLAVHVGNVVLIFFHKECIERILLPTIYSTNFFFNCIIVCYPSIFS